MNQDVTPGPRSYRLLIAVIVLVLVGYAACVASGWLPAAAGEHGAHRAGLDEISHAWAILPFCLLLGAIAILPLLGERAHWWESNLWKLIVALVLGAATLAYLATLHPLHSFELARTTLVHTVVADYIPFIILLFTLYTISGGIRISGDLKAHPATNAKFLLTGALLASFIGTTGAAMLLVRPLLETNSERKHVAHTLVFFILVVCNCGGLLLPLGDPPLFLGYLNGVDFLWTLSLWKSWLLVNGLLIAVYFAWDSLVSYPRETASDVAKDETQTRGIKISGLWPNGLLLLGVVLSVGVLDPGKAVPLTEWHPWPYLREAVQLGLVAASLLLGSTRVRAENDFNFGAILEVAALFIGIFICMQPALEILNVRGVSLGLDTPQKFFWASGWLSSVLDNAPTYLVFFKAAQGVPAGDAPTMAGVSVPLLTAVSLGSVMMGAMTYIGNGPNFMVKTIAEKSGVKMPSFFGYMVYSFLVLLPILVLNAWLFLS